MNDQQNTVEPLLNEETISKKCHISVDSANRSIQCDTNVDMSDDQKPPEKSGQNPPEKSGQRKSTKAKALRIERRLKKIMDRDKCDENQAKDIMSNKLKSKIKTKTIEDYLTENQDSTNAAHKLEV